MTGSVAENCVLRGYHVSHGLHQAVAWTKPLEDEQHRG